MGYQEQLVGARYTLRINGFLIPENHPLRRYIQRIQHTQRRSGLNTLQMSFTDPDFQWRHMFTVYESVKVDFIGYNYDWSHAESFSGYVSEISPSTRASGSELSIMCLNAQPRFTNARPSSRSFKKMSRADIIRQVSKESGIKLSMVTTTELNSKEEELVWSVNSSLVDFLMQITEQVGCRFSSTSLTSWAVYPMISTSTYKNTVSNLNGQGSLIDFQPTYSRFSYQEADKQAPKTASKINPSTKKTTSSTSTKKPTNTPPKRPTTGVSTSKPKAKSTTGSSSGKGSSGSKGQMYYDTRTKTWKKIT